jgi:hypothetical protein
MKVVRMPTIHTGRLYPQKIFLVCNSVRGWVNPRAIVWPVGLCQYNKDYVHIMRLRSFSFKWEYPLLSLRSSSSLLHLIPRLPVTSIAPLTFLSVTCCRWQFLRKMWPIQFAFRLRISCRIFLCSLTLTLLHFSHDRSNWWKYILCNNTFLKVRDLKHPMNNFFLVLFLLSAW